MKVHGHSSQTVFLPRQFSFSSGNHTPNGHVFSPRTPPLRAASAGPLAVRPDGLRDSRDSFSETTSVSRGVSVDGERPAERGRQEKGALGRAATASPQPAPGTEGERRAVSDTGSARSPNSIGDLRRSARMTLRVRPGVRTALARIARDDGVSLSEASATGLEVYARAKIHDQEEALFEPRMRTMTRREIRSTGNRHGPFENKSAIAADQTRILMIELYKRMLLKEGIPLKEINKKLDNAYTMAERNVFNTKTPKFQTLVVQYWQATENQASDRQGHAGGSQTESAPTREAGKPEA